MDYRSWTTITDYAAILEVYSITELLELNDLTDEELLAFLLQEKFITLPDVQPIDFDD